MAVGGDAEDGLDGFVEAEARIMSEVIAYGIISREKIRMRNANKLCERILNILENMRFHAPLRRGICRE